MCVGMGEVLCGALGTWLLVEGFDREEEANMVRSLKGGCMIISIRILVITKSAFKGQYS